MEIVIILFLLHDSRCVAVDEYKTLEECSEALEYVITGYREEGGLPLEGLCQEFKKTTNIERINII